MSQICTGQRIHLRDLRLDDLPAYREWMLPHQRWHETDGPYYEKDTVEEVDERIEDLRERIEAVEAGKPWPDPRARLVIADRETDALVGTVSRYWVMKECHWPAIGIAIFDPENWGRGLATEALALWVDYLFQREEKFHRLDLRTWSGNYGMLRVAEKLGFSLDARFREAVLVKGERFDNLGYGYLRSDWEAKRE